MARYNDADATFKAFENAAWYNNADRDDVAEELLLDSPTVDAVPVANGQWVYYNNNGWRVCPHCKDRRRTFTLDNYCPNCGAKMHGGNE